MIRRFKHIVIYLKHSSNHMIHFKHSSICKPLFTTGGLIIFKSVFSLYGHREEYHNRMPDLKRTVSGCDTVGELFV